MPRNAGVTLKGIMEKECSEVENKIIGLLKHERRIAVDGFDSGVPLEAFIRECYGQFLPRRYVVENGLLLDSTGSTSGKCDIVIRDDRWFSSIRAKSNPLDNLYIPIESVYAVGEVKQKISINTFIDAMKKLVTCSRLARNPLSAMRFSENRSSSDVRYRFEPLITFIVGGGLDKGMSIDDLAVEYAKISRKIGAKDMVSFIYIVGHGVLLLTVNHLGSARFIHMLDDYREKSARVSLLDGALQNGFYSSVSLLVQSLWGRMLEPEDHIIQYGGQNDKIKTLGGDDNTITT